MIAGAAGLEFSYWHVIPTVRNGQYVTAYRTLIGHIERPLGHVHFSEAHYGVYVNPLRRAALAPFADHTALTVRSLQVAHADRFVAKTDVSGSIDLVADVADTTPLLVRKPWQDMPVMPAVVRWRIVRVTRWNVAADFRQTIPLPSAFGGFYARRTSQNHAGRCGRYRIYLARGWDSTTVRNGTYSVEVVAADTRGNSTRFRTSLRVANGLRLR